MKATKRITVVFLGLVLWLSAFAVPTMAQKHLQMKVYSSQKRMETQASLPPGPPVRVAPRVVETSGFLKKFATSENVLQQFNPFAPLEEGEAAFEAPANVIEQRDLGRGFRGLLLLKVSW